MSRAPLRHVGWRGHDGDRGALAGARVLVTGASSGIGAASAVSLAAAGCRLALAGRSATGLAATSAALRDRAGSVTPAAACIAEDLVPTGAPARVVAAATAALGGLDAVVANAGAGWAGPFASMTTVELDAVLDLDLRATAQLLLAVVPHLLVASSPGDPTGPARGIVVVGSVAGRLPVAGEAAYSAAKAGVAGLAEALRAELRPSGVAVSVVDPGVVDTEFFRRRNRPYDRRHPRPVPSSLVADAVVRALATGRPSTVVPAWLSLPIRLRGAAPGAYRWLSDRLA